VPVRAYWNLQQKEKERKTDYHHKKSLYRGCGLIKSNGSTEERKACHETNLLCKRQTSISQPLVLNFELENSINIRNFE